MAVVIWLADVMLVLLSLFPEVAAFVLYPNMVQVALVVESGWSIDRISLEIDLPFALDLGVDVLHKLLVHGPVHLPRVVRMEEGVTSELHQNRSTWVSIGVLLFFIGTAATAGCDLENFFSQFLVEFYRVILFLD